MTALALRDDQTQWDEQQIAVLEAGGIDGDVSDAELAAFLHECQRRKLDPFTRQIYLIGRYDSRKGRKVYRSQTSIDGFRLIARRAADKSGIDYSYEDTIWFDEQGQRHEIWLSSKPPAGAKVVVIRNGSRFDAVARFGAYVQMDRNGNPTGQWRNMADVMVAKCAEALALRKAFPEDLGGIYTEEEMAQADNPQRVTATAEVVRDEPADEDPWLTAALQKASELTFEACAVMWRKSAEMVHEGKISKADAAKLQAVLRERMNALNAAQPEGDAETVEAEVVAPVAAALDPEDPWAAAIEGLASAGEAETLLQDVIDQRGRGEIDPERAAVIEQVIEQAVAARFPTAAGEPVAA
jgi:phage recombination protein Bet